MTFLVDTEQNMSHPAEDYWVDNRYYLSAPSVTTCNGVEAPDLNCSGLVRLGERIHYVRSASTNNPKNSWGWRMPAPYAASKTVEGDAECLATFQYGPSSGVYTKCYKASPPRSNPRMDYVTACRINNSSVPPLPPWPSGWVDYARDILRTNAMNDLKDRQVNLAVSLAEMQQTVDMIADAGRALADMVLCIRRRRCGNLRNRLGKLSFPDAWLQGRYGWMPLLSDIFGLYEMLQMYLRGDMKRLYVKGKSRMKDDAKSFHPDSNWSDALAFFAPTPCPSTYHGCSTERRYEYEGEYFARYRLDATLKSDIYNWLENTGVTDPLLILWEITPYSHVADWFANIGAWIDSINAYEGLTPLSYSFTYGRRVKVKSNYRLIPNSYVSNFALSKADYVDKFEFVREAGFDSASMGTLRFLRKPLNTTQLLDAVAMLYQRFRGR